MPHLPSVGWGPSLCGLVSDTLNNPGGHGGDHEEEDAEGDDHDQVDDGHLFIFLFMQLPEMVGGKKKFCGKKKYMQFKKFHNSKSIW